MTTAYKILPRRWLCGSLIVLALLLGTACASSPPTEFYSLIAVSDPGFEIQLDSSIDSIGVGPVSLPSELDRPSLVSELADGRLKIAAYDVWAGDLDENFTRVMASVLSSHTGIDRVYAEPWDTRFRPSYQLRLDVQQFGGRLGGDVRLDVLWTLTTNAGRTMVHSERSQLSLSTDSASQAAYVSALSALLSEFSKQPARVLEGLSDTALIP